MSLVFNTGDSERERVILKARSEDFPTAAGEQITPLPEMPVTGVSAKTNEVAVSSSVDGLYDPYSAVGQIGYDNIPISVYGKIGGLIELSRIA